MDRSITWFHLKQKKKKERNPQENSQANQFQKREYMKVEKLEIDSHKTICASSRGKSYTPKVVMSKFGRCLCNQIYNICISYNCILWD